MTLIEASCAAPIDPPDAKAEPVRAVTDAEAAHFRLHGWVKLEGFYAPWVVEALLQRARDRMGARPRSVSRTSPGETTADEYDWYARWDGCSRQDPWVKSISHSPAMARAAIQLMGGPVRFYFDHVFVKQPRAEHGGPTPWHQDLPHHPVDRQGLLTIWSPLVECPAKMGSLRFLEGSHRAGLLGRYLNRRDGVTLVDENPWVLERYSISPPLNLRPGDATVHDLMIVHFAPANRTPDPRWVYSNQWVQPNARYTGAPNHRFDGLNLPIDQPIEHEWFPVLTG